MPRLVSTIPKISGLLAVVVILAAGCTNDAGGDTRPSGQSSTPSPTEVVNQPVKGEYSYANAGLNARVKFEGNPGEATLEIKNSTGRTLPKPGLYALTASTGKQIDGRVVSSAAIPDGKTGSYEVVFPPEVGPDTIGLLILLIGTDNYGAFVPPAAG